VRVPILDGHDDPQRLKHEAAKESLDAFDVEPRKLELVELTGDGDPLAAFAAEPAERFELVEPRERAERLERLERFERPERPERLEQPERFERLEQPERFERLKLAFGVLSLAAVAFAAVTALNFFGDRQGPQPDIVTQARVESRDASVPLVDPRTERAASVAEVGRINETPQAPALSEPRRVEGPALSGTARLVEGPALNRGADRSAPVPTDVVEQPPRAPVAGNAPLRAAESASPPAAQLPAPTTGVAPAELTTRPPVAAPIVAAVPVAPPAAPAAAASPPAAPAPAPATRVAAPRAAVESVLGRYASAFSALDAGGAKAVWPSVNQRSLEKAFDSLEQQEFDLGTCDIMVLPPRALAQCDGTARYTPKVGNKKARTVARHWTFRLQQDGQDWSIESVDSR
jgi:hypothetical protein